MLYSQDQIFIHIPKTGGTSIRNFLSGRLAWGSPEMPIGYKAWWHRPMIFCPNRVAKNRTGVAIIRNPWDFYVSYWAYDPNRNVIGDLYHDKNKTKESFQKFLKNLLDGDSKNVYQLPQKIQVPIVQIIKDNKVGLLTIYHAYMTTTEDPGNIFITNKKFNFENFKTNTVTYRLEELELNFSKAFKVHSRFHKEFTNSKKQNQSRRDRDYRVYYTPELRQLVAQRDRYIIKKFNYSF